MSIIIGAQPNSTATPINKTGIGALKTPKIFVPYIFFWYDLIEDQKVYMTAAFQYEKHNFGEKWPVASDGKEQAQRKADLISIVTDTLNVLVHHGKLVLDHQGNIDAEKVRDIEAHKFMSDPLWGNKQQAFAKALKVKEITSQKAKELGLL